VIALDPLGLKLLLFSDAPGQSPIRGKSRIDCFHPTLESHAACDY
jgi:hypothetical protein